MVVLLPDPMSQKREWGFVFWAYKYPCPSRVHFTYPGMMLFVVVVATLLLSGCAGSQRAKATESPPAQNYFVPVPQTGWVPVDIQNPSLLSQEVYVFEGSTTVNLIPDTRSGGWMFNRPAMAHFVVNSAHSTNNWHEYERLMLPRNASFVLVSRTHNLWGAGPPEYYSVWTGPDPYAVRYTRITPSYPPATAGGLVTLRERTIAPFGSGPLIINYTIDLRSVGPGVVNQLMK